MLPNLSYEQTDAVRKMEPRSMTMQRRFDRRHVICCMPYTVACGLFIYLVFSQLHVCTAQKRHKTLHQPKISTALLLNRRRATWARSKLGVAWRRIILQTNPREARDDQHKLSGVKTLTGSTIQKSQNTGWSLDARKEILVVMYVQQYCSGYF